MPLPPVIFEDDSLLAFDKPEGLAVKPDGLDRSRESLMAAVHTHFGKQLAPVHRLESEMSGLLLCAKTKPALDFTSGQFQAKTAVKVYHALVAILPAERAMKMAAPVRTPEGGLLATFVVDLGLGPDQHQPGRMRVVNGRAGKAARTEFRVLEKFGRFVLMECRPSTSGLHQVRVHLAAIGAPVLNDTVYGEPAAELKLSDLKRGYKGREEEKPLITRLALHASELTLTHPMTREPLTLRAPLPSAFEIALKNLRKFIPRGVRGPKG
jgi:23S rRNA-/tRNA-specific pseudouridylate synthase